MLLLFRGRTRTGLCRTRTGGGRNDIVVAPDQVDRLMMGLTRPMRYWRLTGSCHSLRRRTLKLCLFLYNSKGLGKDETKRSPNIRELQRSKQRGTIKPTTSSSPSSRVEGSGIGPSITHLFDSYLVRIKFSILLFHNNPSERQSGCTNIT